MDTMARSSMWKYGMDYKHGTGHGIGYFTTVHEGYCPPYVCLKYIHIPLIYI